MKAWLRRWQERRQDRAIARHAIPDDLWALTLARLPFLARRSTDDLARLRRLSSLFLQSKEFHGVGTLTVDDEMAVCIAAQACLPVLHLGLARYDSFVGVVVHADEVVARRSVTDDSGVVHEYDETLSGEAMAGGPVMLSWRDVAGAGESADWAYNVVIHEFAHVLDLEDGQADGIPVLPSLAARTAWAEVLDEAFEDFCDAVDAGQDTVLDPYGATGIDEFFAVATEAFFVASKNLRAEQAALYRLLARYFKQDPAAHDGV